MNYPGNQGQSGGWPTEQPPSSPYSPGPGPAGNGSPYGQSPNDGPHQNPHENPHDKPYDSQYQNPYENQYENPYDAPRDDDGPFAPRPRDPYGPQAPYGQGGYEQGGHEPPTQRFGQGPADELTGPGRHGHAPRGRRPSPLLIAGAAVVAGIVLIGGGMALSHVLRGDEKPQATGSAPPRQSTGAQPSPSASPTPTRPAGSPGNSRTTDPRPLKLAEVFRHRGFKVSGKSYVMTVRRADRACNKTVHGAKLAVVLRRGSCNQVLRATFASGDGRLIGTVGVANLRSATAARAAARVWNVKDAWLLPVAGPGRTRTIGKGSALGTFQYKGHYLLMTWVQKPDGKEIPASQHSLISKFGQDVMLGSGLFEALNYRGIEGKPLQT